MPRPLTFYFENYKKSQGFYFILFFYTKTVAPVINNRFDALLPSAHTWTWYESMEAASKNVMNCCYSWGKRAHVCNESWVSLSNRRNYNWMLNFSCRRFECHYLTDQFRKQKLTAVKSVLSWMFDRHSHWIGSIFLLRQLASEPSLLTTGVSPRDH